MRFKPQRFNETLSNHEDREGHEGFGNCYISISYFVLFASFMVKFFQSQSVESLGIVVKNLLYCGLRDLPIIGPLL
jgi:hypothetical protein